MRLVLILLATLITSQALAQPFSDEVLREANSKLETWKSGRPSYKFYLQDSYDPFGLYLNYGTGLCNTAGNRIINDQGLAAYKTHGSMYYHPVMTAQCGLYGYGYFLRGHSEGLPEAETNASVLIALQDARGAYPYSFPHSFHQHTLSPGWTSGMAQGQAMSLMARLYKLTGERRYLDSGRMALQYMLTPIKDGGVLTDMGGLDPSLKNYMFIEEYVTEPHTYTLNGFMFALLGLYDWSQLPANVDAGQNRARENFEKGIETLHAILPYYRVGPMSAYDLVFLTSPGTKPNLSISYHGVHIYLLHVLYAITKDETLKNYETMWDVFPSGRPSQIR